MDQPGKVASPAHSQLKRENYLCPRARLRIWSCETVSAVSSRVSLLISILRLNLVLTHGIPPEFRGGPIYLLKKNEHLVCIVTFAYPSKNDTMDNQRYYW